MKALISVGCTLLITSNLLCASVHASQASNIESIDSIMEPSQQSLQFFKRQVDGGSSIGNTLKSLLDRYPQKTAEFVSIAFIAYPDRFEDIIKASVSSKPMFVDEIVMLANQHKVANPTEIIAIAVNAEPSYAGVATSAACKNNPEYFNEIVRTAVTAEPDSADQIAKKLVDVFPSKTMEILITTIKEVPYVGKYVLDALLATVVDDDAKSENMIIVSVQELAKYPDAIERLVELAHQRDIDSEKVRLSAIRGGLSEDDIALVINEHYIKSTSSSNKN